LTAWYALILTAGLGLFGGLIWLSLRHRLLDEIDRDLAGRASRFETYFRNESAEADGAQVLEELEEFSQALPPSSYLELHAASRLFFRYPPGPRASGKMRVLQRRFVYNGEVFDLELAAPMGDALHTLDLLALLLWSLLPVVIAIACAGGAWLSRRALRPVQDIINAARTIGIENLSDRLPVPATADELARLTEVLNEMFARLESAVKTLSQFAADASHELRTPLTVVRTTAELALRRERTPESYRDSLQEVAAEAQRMTRLVEDLLTLARAETATVEMPRAPLDLRDVLRNVCREMQSLAELRQIQVQTELGDEAALISGNQSALHRLFLVLLDNALKYSRTGGQVVLRVERSDSWVSVAIQDFGAGISAADLPHIFKRFYRAGSDHSGEGHGLGLALAQSIARTHGAAIEVSSQEGAWSVFRVRFVSRDAVAVLAGG
jgi:heavy metal sensor kinase